METYLGMNLMRGITHVLGYVPVEGLHREMRLRVLFLETGLGYSKHENHVITQNC